MNEAILNFTILCNNFDPDKITSLLGIQPTKVVQKGNPRPKFAYWEISTKKIEAEIVDIYAMSAELISILEVRSNEITNVIKDYQLEAVLNILLKISTDEDCSTPIIGFDNHVLKFLAQVGASIDIDTYKN